MDNSTAFHLYRDYAKAVRERAVKSMHDPLCEDDFVRVWHSLPKTERSRWEERLKTGFTQVILNESSHYASVLGSDDSACLKAA